MEINKLFNTDKEASRGEYLKYINKQELQSGVKTNVWKCDRPTDYHKLTNFCWF